MTRRLALVLALALGICAPAQVHVVDAQPRTRASKPIAKPVAKRGTKKPVAKPAKKTVTRAPVRPTKRTVAKRPVRPTPSQPTAAMVMVHGALRAPTKSHGRTVAELTREEATAEAIEKILRGPLRYGTTGLYVVDAATGKELFAVHPDDPLNPASNVKLISTAAALDLVGPGFRYTTRVLGATPGTDGVIAGDVYLLGSYDPTLGLDDVRALGAKLAAAGVKRIEGGVVVGGTSTRDGIYRSRVRVDITAGEPGALPAVTVTPATDFIEITTTATTGKRPRVKGRLTVDSKVVTKDDGSQRLTIAVGGAIGKGKTVSRWVWTRDRHLHTAHVLRTAMRDAGIEVKGDVTVRELPQFVDETAAIGRLPVTLVEHQSEPLSHIVAQVNKRSINWLSDRVIATATALSHDEKPSMDKGIDAMYAWLGRAAGIERDKLVVDTGSGLSYRTQFSPRQIVSVVRAASGLVTHEGEDLAYAAACADAWKTSLSVGGVDGTLRRRFRSTDLRGRIHGKTGTLSNVIALSGLLEGPDGRTLAFALVTNGHTPARKNLVRQAHEDVLVVLDDYLAALAKSEPVPAVLEEASGLGPRTSGPDTAPTATADPSIEPGAPTAVTDPDEMGDLDEGDNESAIDPETEPAPPAP
ncbi:MAG TPA: D-alanyl-D-alanine carboxypeptidase [Kofleriaceae bacterium]|nr:D-alanyl-D-alanine carboxypeptidase [Kofleriaceae bacterium]